ncbi:hypothetical protein DENSPDRAFT_886238 [Dentipellis sp. KUC8613]|nr:hypothetical protein DENSPDRAFT_886238 [Dentipellis sp. KUC8613]
MSYAPPSVSCALAVCAPSLSISRARLTIRPRPWCHLTLSAPSHACGSLLRGLVPARPPPLLRVLTFCAPSLSRAFPFHPIHVGSCRLRRLASCRPRCLTSRPLTTRCHSAVTHPVRPSRAVWTPVTPSRAPWRAIAAVWCPVALYYAPLCPLGPLATPSCRATLPRCARAPHHIVWTPAMLRAALSCPLAPRCAMLRAVAPCCAAPRRLDRCLAPCPSPSCPLMPSDAPWRARVALLRHTTPSVPARSLLPPSDSATHHLAAPHALSLAADLRSRGPTGCVAAAHALVMAQAARPLAVPLTLSPVYPSPPTVSCRAGPSNGVGGTLSHRPTL